MRNSLRARILHFAFALLSLSSARQVSAQSDVPRWRAHSSWNFRGVRVGLGAAAGNRDDVQWVEFSSSAGPQFHTINMDVDPLYALAPSVGLQVGHMTSSHLFVTAEIGYTRVAFKSHVRIPGVGLVAVTNQPLHGKYVRVNIGVDLLPARLVNSNWALNVAVNGQMGQVSTDFFGSGAGASAAGLVLSADRVMSRSPVTGEFNTLSPYVGYNFVSHNWPKYVTWGVALRFHKR